jgi:site-specific DNA-adenine methylase
MVKKKAALLKKIQKQLPNQEREFLEFMGGTVNFFINWKEKSLDELLETFINFEEEESGEELTEKAMNKVLKIYIPGFKDESGVF